MTDRAADTAAAVAELAAATALAGLDRIDPSGDLSRGHMEFVVQTCLRTDIDPATKNRRCIRSFDYAEEFVAVRDRYFASLVATFEDSEDSWDSYEPDEQND